MRRSTTLSCGVVVIMTVLSLGLLGQSALAGPIPIPGLYNTGVDDSGVVLPVGSAEAHWDLTGPIGSAKIILPLSAGSNSWTAAPTGSAWIGPSNGSVTDPVGLYVFSLMFDLTGIDLESLSIAGDYTSDNNGEIFLNGVSKGFVNNPQQYFGLTHFVLAGDFLPEVNTLQFRVNNNPGLGLNPTGLVVGSLEATSTTIPEPTAVVLMALGMLSYFCALQRHRRKAAGR